MIYVTYRDLHLLLLCVMWDFIISLIFIRLHGNNPVEPRILTRPSLLLGSWVYYGRRGEINFSSQWVSSTSDRIELFILKRESYIVKGQAIKLKSATTC